jgi:hypothetical protein
MRRYENSKDCGASDLGNCGDRKGNGVSVAEGNETVV